MREVGQAKELVEKMLTFIEQVSKRKLRFSSIVDLNTGATSDPTDRIVAAVNAALRRAKAEVLRAEAKAMRHASTLYGNDGWRERKAVQEWADELDARAAQIDDGEST